MGIMNANHWYSKLKSFGLKFDLTFDAINPDAMNPSTHTEVTLSWFIALNTDNSSVVNATYKSTTIPAIAKPVLGHFK
jgi:hypothetical protein